MNTEYLLIVKNKDPKVYGYISTILDSLYEENLLSDEFILRWDEGRDEAIQKHWLYEKERNDLFRVHSKDFLDWLKE
jgi:hypothetical protein